MYQDYRLFKDLEIKKHDSFKVKNRVSLSM